MGLHIVIGRSGRGKTKKIFEILKNRQNSQEGIIKGRNIIVVPDQLSFSMERTMLEEVGVANSLGIQIVGFSMLSQRVLEYAGGIKRKLINSTGRTMVIKRIVMENLEKFDLYNDIADKAGFTDLLLDMIKELKIFGKSPEDIEEAIKGMEEGELKRKLKDLLIVYREYERQMKENYCDGEDRLTLAIENFKKADFLRNAYFYIDGFSNFTPLQLRLIREMLKVEKSEVFITLPMDKNTSRDHRGPFQLPYKNYERLKKLEKELSLKPNPEIYVEDKGRYKSEELDFLEANYYSLGKKLEKNIALKDISIVKAESPREELEVIAYDILERVRSGQYRFKDLAILMRNIEDYESELNTVMGEYKIPIFNDKRKSMENNPLFSLINSFFDIEDSFYSHDSVFRYLKSGLSSLEYEEICLLENYCLENGIEKESWHWDKWSYPMKYRGNDEETKKDIKAINQYKNVLMDSLKGVFEKLKEASNVREKATIFYDFLVEDGILDRYEGEMEAFKLKDIDKYNEFKQTAQSLMDILDQLVEIMGDIKLSTKEFGKIIIEGLRSFKFATVPPSLDQVIAGEISRIKASKVKGIYIVGVNDGVFPRKFIDGGILNGKDREKLRDKGIILSEEAKESMMNEDFYSYEALSFAGDFIHISYPTSNSLGDSLRPSSLIQTVKGLFPYLGVKEVSNMEVDDKKHIVTEEGAFRKLIGKMRRFYDGEKIEPLWKELYGYYKDNEDFKGKLEIVEDGLVASNEADKIEAKNLQRLFGDKIYLTVSKAETYNKCPFSYFVKYGLGAKERREHIPEKYDSGNLKHEVLDFLTRHINEKNISWDSLKEDFIEDRVEMILDKILNDDDNSVFLSSNQLKYEAQRIKRSLKSSVRVISEQVRRGAFIPLASEISFGEGEKIPPMEFISKDLKKIIVTGKIDRVDILETLNKKYARIIDYKSSAKDINFSEFIEGIQLQLLIYLDVVLKNEDFILKIIESQKSKDSKDSLEGAREDIGLEPGGIFYMNLKRPEIEVENQGEITDEKAFEIMVKNSRLSGLTLNEDMVIDGMDLNEDNLVTKVERKKGSKELKVNSTNYVLNREDFKLLRDYAELLMKEMANRLLSGEIPVRPYKFDNFINCKYCNYKSICRFDPNMEGNEINIIEKRNRDEAIELIRKKLEKSKEDK